ncbi:MAG: lipoyl domain-containing protein [Pseudomonadota bacterium]
MNITLKVPKMAVSMKEATIAEWFVEDGDTVRRGQPIYAIETEKTTVDIESPFAGVITRIAEVGGSYGVGEPVARIVQ